MVKFDPRKPTQSLAFEYELERLSGLVSDMRELRSGTSVEDLAGEAPVLDRWVHGERPALCLMGLSTGHPTLPGTGRLITTSDLWLFSEDGTWARTLSRWYRLGDPLGPGDLVSGGKWSWQ